MSRELLTHEITEKKLAYGSVNQAACAIRFLFGKVLSGGSVCLDRKPAVVKC